MRFTISDESGYAWTIDNGPVLVYLNTSGSGEVVFHWVDCPDVISTELDERDKAVLGALLGLGVRAAGGDIA